MTNYQTNLSVLNAICVFLGGTGGHTSELAAWEDIVSLLSLKSKIDTWQNDGEDVYVSGIPSTQWVGSLYVPNPLEHSNTLIDRGHAIRQNCSIKSIKVHVYTYTVGANWAFKLFRLNIITGLYDCIASRDFVPTVGDAINTIILSSPVNALEGDIPGLFIPAEYANRIYVCYDASKTTPLPKFVTDVNVGVGESNAMTSNVADYFLNFGCYSNRPYAAFIGDSIFGGGNSYVYPADGRRWQTDQEDSAYPTPGGEIPSIELSVPNRISTRLPVNFTYQNFAKSGITFDQICAVKKQLERAVLASPQVVAIHCGVNDVAQGRTWEQISANLDTIRLAFPVGTKFMLDEILPWECSDAYAIITRQINANYQIYCDLYGWKLIACHDEMGTLRVSTGELDNMNPVYKNGDSVHLNAVGVDKLAEINKRYWS